MAHDTADVLIIGAGAAGLAAANVLSSHGRDVLLLEGRTRLGGRIHTMHDPAWPLPIERGAEFIHGKPPETLSILRAGACCYYDVTDEHWLYNNGRLQKQDSFFEQVEKVLAVVNKVGPTDMSFDDALTRFGSRFSPVAKRAARSFVEGFDAADSSVVSSHWLKAAQEASDEIEGDRLFRVQSGYNRIIDVLDAGIDDPCHRIELSTLVRRIEWSRDGATVHAVNNQGDVLALPTRHVLITVPVGVLQLANHEEGHIAFNPVLPPAKLKAIQQIKMGPVVKVVLRFHEPLWEKSIPDLDFFHAPGEPFHTWWTTLPLRSTVLTAWAGGSHALALSTKSSDTLLTVALTTLAKLLRLSRRTLTRSLAASHVCNWQTEPLSRGAYSYTAIGGSNAVKNLAAPLASTLFFAGEATQPGMSGTVAAALASGHRAATQIMKAG